MNIFENRTFWHSFIIQSLSMNLWIRYCIANITHMYVQLFLQNLRSCLVPGTYNILYFHIYNCALEDTINWLYFVKKYFGIKEIVRNIVVLTFFWAVTFCICFYVNLFWTFKGSQALKSDCSSCPTLPTWRRCACVQVGSITRQWRCLQQPRTTTRQQGPHFTIQQLQLNHN